MAPCLSLVLGDVAAEVFSFLYLGLLLIMDQRKKTQKTEKHPQLTKKMLGICLPIAFSSYVRSALVTIKQVMIPNGLEKSGISCDEAMSQYGLIGGMVMPVIVSLCTTFIRQYIADSRNLGKKCTA